MAGSWFVSVGGKVHGPFDGAKLQALVAAGQLTSEMPVANSTSGPWMRAGAIRGLFPAGASVPSGSAVPAAQPPAAPVAAAPPGAPVPAPPPAAPDVFVPQIATGPSRSRPRKNASAAKVWGVIGGLAGVAVVLVGIGVLIYTGLRQTDAAAIKLIKTSMQETFAENPGVAKPVKVLEVELRGTGTNRTGTATVKFGNQRHEIPFTAKVTYSGNEVKVDWKTKELPLEPAEGGDQYDAAFREQLQAFIAAASDVESLEAQLSSEDAPLTPRQFTDVVRKLVRGWGELQQRSKAMRTIADARGLENAPDPEKAKQFLAALMAVESAIPAIDKVLNTILASQDEAEIQAAVETYWEISSGVGAVFRQIAPTD